ncbi:hypothetical protein HZB08_00620, partial [Candidatus Saganbacteria bacterium]|nr:hypothetical protein [Candidatus Saganbacteria bacterium]
MKRNLLVVSCLLLVICSATSAEVFIGSRQAGMGGTGVASAVGINAVPYNPAGMLQGPSGEFLLSLGAAGQGVDQIAQSLSKVSDPAQYMIDNYASSLDADGSVSGIIGFNLNHLGISVVLPNVSAVLTKTASSLAGAVSVKAAGGAVLTVGNSFSIPGIPLGSLAVGANIKAFNVGYGTLTMSTTPTPTVPVTATQTVGQGSGTGYDVGARANVEIPFVTDFSFGIAMRDLSETIKYTPKTRTDTYSITSPTATPTLTKGTEIEGAQQEATAPTT